MSPGSREKLSDCQFCEISRGDSDEIEMIASTDRWIAFFPLEPAALGHTLVIPTRHVENFLLADDSTTREMAIAVRVVGDAISRALGPSGMNLITSAGEAAEQTVFHLHFHLLPRWAGDHFGPIWPRGDQAGRGSRLTAEKIRRELSQHQLVWR